MKVKSHHDLKTSVTELYVALSDTARWERAAMRRGVEIVREDAGSGLVAGATWKAKADWRGKMRHVTVVLRDVTPPTAMIFDFSSEMFSGVATIDLVDLSARQTRFGIEMELKPKTLAARILLQGAKLRRQHLQRRFAQKLGSTLDDLATRLT